MSNVQELEYWIFQRLRAYLIRRHPDLVAKFEQAPPRTREEVARWVSELTFKAPEPWYTLLSATLVVSTGLEDLQFASQSLGSATDGRAVAFFMQMTPMVASSCFERMEFLVKRLSRNKLIHETTAEELLSQLKAARESIWDVRNLAAHGPHLGLRKGGLLELDPQMRYWELIALSGERGSSLPAYFRSGLQRRDEIYTRQRPLVEATTNAIEVTSARLLIAVKEHGD